MNNLTMKTLGALAFLAILAAPTQALTMNAPSTTYSDEWNINVAEPGLTNVQVLIDGEEVLDESANGTYAALVPVPLGSEPSHVSYTITGTVNGTDQALTGYLAIVPWSALATAASLTSLADDVEDVSVRVDNLTVPANLATKGDVATSATELNATLAAATDGPTGVQQATLFFVLVGVGLLAYNAYLVRVGDPLKDQYRRVYIAQALAAGVDVNDPRVQDVLDSKQNQKPSSIKDFIGRFRRPTPPNIAPTAAAAAFAGTSPPAAPETPPGPQTPPPMAPAAPAPVAAPEAPPSPPPAQANGAHPLTNVDNDPRGGAGHVQSD